ncbi:MAG: site-specific integrase [Bacillus sp. (in: firmicutes)]
MKGYVRKRGDKWSYTVDIGKDPITGKRKQKTKSGFKTKKEAETALNELVYEVNNGSWIAPKELTFKEFSLDWYESYKYKLKETTSEQYSIKINKWINPFFGNNKIQEIKPVHGQAFVSKLLDSLQPDTAHKVLSVAKMIFKHAVHLEIISKSPLENITISNPKNKKKNTWSFEELNHFLNITKKYDEFYYDVFTVAAFTGLRKGEVMGLRRIDPDFSKNIINIRQSITETKKGVQIGLLKTPSSYRKVAIDSFVSSILKERINKNNAYRLKFGPEYQDNGLIFCHPDGKPFRPTSLNRPFRKYINIAGVPKIRFHDMRHTHATLLLELNTNPKIVADRLGHSSVKITLDTYSHASIGLQSDVANVFSKKVNEK